jgi:NADH-quinone oxidoreductase subunit H
MGINKIVEAQNVWFIVLAPIAALIFFISSIAEIGRAPFDLTEAESEIVAGFHIEYTGMKFGLFYAGELLHALTVGALFSSLFLGGWRGWGAEAFPMLGVVYLFLKAFLGYYVIMWIKYSVPRIRIDHMLALNWKFLTPLSLAVLIITAILHKLLENTSSLIYTGSMLLANVILGWITLVILNRYARLRRQNFEEDRPVARSAEATAPSSIS